MTPELKKRFSERDMHFLVQCHFNLTAAEMIQLRGYTIENMFDEIPDSVAVYYLEN